jgi:uncharacterized protein
MTLEIAMAVAGLGAGIWTLRQLSHWAILRGLKAPRVPHGDGICRLGLPADQLLRVPLPGPGGRRLAAWLALPEEVSPAGAPAVLAMHGWGANASMMGAVVAPLVDTGMAVLLLDARCHGESDDESFTSLPRFAEDIEAGLRWLRERWDIDSSRIALLGHSVGAAAALLQASRCSAELPVRAVVSVSSFAHPHEVMRRWLAEHRLPYTIIGWYVLRYVQRVIGARFDDIAPIHTVAQMTCPVLLVHGRDDTIVPLDDALRLQRSAKKAELLVIEGDHDLRESLGPHAPEIVDFLRRSLEGSAVTMLAHQCLKGELHAADTPCSNNMRTLTMNRLEDSEIAVLLEALDDEYQAWATYDQVLTDFGQVRPFVNIREAEARHIQALLTLFERYGVEVPSNSWPGKVERYANLQTACEAGVAAEIANGEMYERLIAQALQADIVEVLRRLQEASQQRHLPAFQRCTQRGARDDADGGPVRGGKRIRHRGGI